MQLFRARGGAARTVDMHDHGLRRRLPKPLQRLDTLAIGANEAGYGDASDRARARTRQQCRPGSMQRRANGNDGADRQQNCQHTPESEFPPHPAAIDDDVGIERHGFVSLRRNQARQCGRAPWWSMVRSKRPQLWQTKEQELMAPGPKAEGI